jgi:hypothetical protein
LFILQKHSTDLDELNIVAGNFIFVLIGSLCHYEVQIESKGKVVPVLPPTEHHAMKAYWRSGGTAPAIL